MDSVPSSPPLSMDLKVRYVECDMQNMAHTEAIDELLGGYREVVPAGVDLVVAAADLQFRSPARFDDRLTVQITIHPPGNTSLRSDFTINRGEDLLAECRMVHVCVDAATYEKQPWPQWLRAKLPAAD